MAFFSFASRSIRDEAFEIQQLAVEVSSLDKNRPGSGKAPFGLGSRDLRPCPVQMLGQGDVLVDLWRGLQMFSDPLSGAFMVPGHRNLRCSKIHQISDRKSVG